MVNMTTAWDKDGLEQLKNEFQVWVLRELQYIEPRGSSILLEKGQTFIAVYNPVHCTIRAAHHSFKIIAAGSPDRQPATTILIHTSCNNIQSYFSDWLKRYKGERGEDGRCY